MKKVIIKMRGTQTSDGNSEVIEFATEGVMRTFERDVILSYTEGELLGGNIKTRLTASGNKSVVIERKGDLNSKLIIEKGMRTSCFYSVPEGDLTLQLYGEDIQNSLGEKGGLLRLKYSVDADTQNISENEIEITVSEV